MKVEGKSLIEYLRYKDSNLIIEKVQYEESPSEWREFINESDIKDKKGFYFLIKVKF